MKEFVFGAQCSGKTRLVRHLRDGYPGLNIVEMDEQIRELCDGAWPDSNDYKEDVLVPTVLRKVSAMPSVMFFENHMSRDRTEGLREAGFHVTLLTVARDVLLARNVRRMAEEGYDDASLYLDGQLANIDELQAHGLIDRVIDGEQPTPDIAREILTVWPEAELAPSVS